jgi:tRNA A37 threonylcarbamoyladenosine biosynthesis protein TsaE
MGTAYKKYRVCYLEASKHLDCYRKSADDAVDFIGEMLRKDGVDVVELWAVELPERGGDHA